MRIHFIAIGGSAMHNLAIALHKQGYQVSGSDDEIFEPSKGRLKKYGLLPAEQGWDKQNISEKLDAVILGMHAKPDNPELKKAEQLKLPVYSFPSYLYEHAKNKKRVVIGGSHGKTTITAMILHALHSNNIDVDYMVGAQLQGFEVMVKLSEKADTMIFEGDEYLTSAQDRRPKFHVYKPHLALLSGIAWDHFNVFPTFDNYVDQFRQFVNLLPASGSLIYYQGDKNLQMLAKEYTGGAKLYSYHIAPHKTSDGKTIIEFEGKQYPMEIFGDHNLKNMQGAMMTCRELGLKPEEFFTAMQYFKGASNRLERLGSKNGTQIFKDFAHSPSKVKATSEAVKKQFKNSLTGVLELHTYSSLNKEFLSQYKGALDAVDFPVVFFNEHALKLKRLPLLEKEDIFEAFQNKNIKVFNQREELENYLIQQDWQNNNLLLMSSGNFDGMDKKAMSERILEKV